MKEIVLDAKVDNLPQVLSFVDEELEKSIVASLAKDVLVGVKGDRIDITMVYGLNS